MINLKVLSTAAAIALILPTVSAVQAQDRGGVAAGVGAARAGGGGAAIGGGGGGGFRGGGGGGAGFSGGGGGGFRAGAASAPSMGGAAGGFRSAPTAGFRPTPGTGGAPVVSGGGVGNRYAGGGYAGRGYYGGLGGSITMDNPQGGESKALLTAADGSGLRCDFRGSWGQGGGVCRDDRGREYDVQLRPAPTKP